MDAVVAIVPDNIFAAMGANDVLAVMFFALFFGIGLMLVSTPRTEALKTAIEGIFEVVMKLIGLVIQLAPIAVFCFMFHLAAQFGWALIIRPSAFVGIALLPLALQMLVVFPLLPHTLATTSPSAFSLENTDAFVLSFATPPPNP